MSKKILSLLLAVLLISGIFAGCASKEEIPETANETTEKSAQPIVMKVGHTHSAGTPRYQSFEKFKEMVEERSNGAIKVEIYPSGQLGNEQEMIEQAKLGTIQGVRAGRFDDVATELLVYTMPFLFDDVESFQKVTRGEIGKKIAKAAEKNNIIILSTGDAGGFRNITNNVRPIKSPEDLKGLKIRTPGVESIIKTMETFGANPVSIPYVETYMSLKTGVADGQENPCVNIESMKFDEVQKYMSVIEYQVHPDPFYVNLEWFNSLSKENQDLVQKAAEDMTSISDEMTTKANVEALEKIKANLEVNVLTDEEKEKFKELAKPVYDYFVNEKGYFTQELIDEIKAQ
ncbi:TRAP transporter substrate-binding protein [Marinisporobacter balticus]|uniref:C4-dicarboxylate-binding protein DctP n=1 Tax=Marinisporobacter balticus TaxID=2018667 RepID=A0A4R2KTV8_9FIRM|nr:TRAP transporter substrate-binding protein [Marinisporobacter balticus]TCO74546.1 C4-dicarboxylate-binding protein DctP [Marinisporobacter balticus]